MVEVLGEDFLRLIEKSQFVRQSFQWVNSRRTEQNERVQAQHEDPIMRKYLGKYSKPFGIAPLPTLACCTCDLYCLREHSSVPRKGQCNRSLSIGLVVDLRRGREDSLRSSRGRGAAGRGRARQLQTKVFMGL